MRCGAVPGSAGLHCLAALVGVLALCARPSTAAVANRYLLVSSPKDANVQYAKLLSAQEAALRKPLKLRPLSLPGKLKEPMGISADNGRMVVYIADPAASAIWLLPVFVANDGKLVPGDQKQVVSGVKAKWCSVDAVGNLFYTEGESNAVKRVDGLGLSKLLNGEQVTLMPVDLYSAAGPPAVAFVKKPQGIAVDNFHMYWANGEDGHNAGSVIRGLENPSDVNKELDLTSLSANTQVVYGICLSSTALFYTDDAANVHGMRRGGGSVATITDKLQAPRGCSWDGDGTVYVADRHGNAIYAFAGDTPSLSPRNVKKALDISDPYGLTVFSGARALTQGSLAVFAAAVAAWLLF